MGVLLGLLVAVSFGSGDFVGARASGRASTAGVLMVGQFSALLGAAIVAGLVSAEVTGHDLVFGALAGSVNVVGLGLLYQGLSSGRMSVVAPVTAVIAAVVPVTWGLIDGERPSALVLVGVGCAVLAGALLAREADPEDAVDEEQPEQAAPTRGFRSPLVIAVGAGAGLGASFVLYAETSTDSGNFPVLAARAAAVVLVGTAVLLWSRRSTVVFPQGRARWLALLAGALDVAGSTLLLVALRRGEAVIVAPVASLAPGMTVILAWQLLRERISRPQLIGLGVAGLGVVLIASG